IRALNSSVRNHNSHMTLPLTVEKSPKSTAFVRPRDSIPRIIRELWDSRDLVAQFVLRDLTVRYAQAVMGFAWALLMPMLIVGAGMMFRVVVSTLSNTPLESSS